MEEDPETGEWSDTLVYETDGEVTDVEIHEGSVYVTMKREAILRLDPPPDLGGQGTVLGPEIPFPTLLTQLLAATSAAFVLRSRD